MYKIHLQVITLNIAIARNLESFLKVPANHTNDIHKLKLNIFISFVFTYQG